ncbi:MAG: deoxyribodipyrimidine photo-lyase [Alphaproteobacteria bacterium]|nr:deoxyribodipyrimidine photo-lyase [Alphaproteobacteria bacterium]
MEGLLSRVLRYWRPERKETTALAGRDERRGAPVLMWFRRDLRLADNPALAWASQSGRPVIPFFLLDDEERRRGGASRWWLHGSLDALGGSLARIGSRLILRRGPAGEAVAALAEETGAADIVWNRLYEPALVERDTAVKAQCRDAGLAPRSFNAALLFEPWAVRTQTGGHYRVFTPFWRQCLKQGFEPRQGTVRRLPPPADWPASEELADWLLRPTTPDWAAGLRETWQPGEAGARLRLERFLGERASGYAEGREFPADEGTGRLSPHLHFGEIGPRQVAAALGLPEPGSGAYAFLRQIGWREFSYHLLHHNPDMDSVNLQRDFDRMPWRDAPEGLQAWQRGRTGYPLVDAGMRELWTTGWMHNRARMVVASFLTKHLLIDWRSGAGWFLDTLVDADLANNSAGWQWVAGSGADAAPYFRIFNPVAQSRRFDAGGGYLRKWLPELRRLPGKWIHAPWEAPEAVLAEAGVRLGEAYPRPIVDHRPARERALGIYRNVIRVGA